MEEPERKKLKSAADGGESALPPGWTEHKAPSGHKYYYNKETKKSTYTRPVAEVPVQPTPQQPYSPQRFPANNYNGYPGQSWQNGYNAYTQTNAYVAPAPYQASAAGLPYGNSHGVYPDQRPHQQQPFQRRPQPPDRPKRKAVIPDCSPWILIYTKLGRRFVHNLETQESYWKFPEDVMKAVIEFDRLGLEKKLERGDKAGSGTGANNVPVAERRRRRSESLQREDEAAMAAELAAAEQEAATEEHENTRPSAGPADPKPAGDANDDDSSEYEEIEVTDDEDEQGGDNTAEANDRPLEFDEDDIAYQLAAMGQSYGLDPGEYGDIENEDDYEEGAQGLPLTDQDSTALFRDLLDDWHISPYTPWETLISDGAILSDERYTVLPTTKSRKEAWDAWSRDRIVSLKAQREKTERLDPRIPYLSLLATHASPKLYWPEFRRKFKKEPEMRDAKLADKEREKLYREHISRLKMPASILKKDLQGLLGTLPLWVLNRDTSVDALPKELLSDVRFISLVPSVRVPIITQFISSLGPAPVDGDGETAEEAAEREKQRAEREKREAALEERERRVEEDKRKSERGLRMGRERLREGEREIEQALRVYKQGLKAQLVGQERAGATDAAVIEHD